MLTNQMIYAGYDVRSTCDPMWGETILSKFPRDIVKPILIASQTQSNQTVDDLMALLKKEFAAKGYVEGRLGPRNFGKVDITKDIKSRPHSNEGRIVHTAIMSVIKERGTPTLVQVIQGKEIGRRMRGEEIIPTKIA
ncbi:hypothetical protein OESDEN_02537 [Oesophagostomum dentatum]|uniref:Uncharacterized protein n=1 Tax=Oesophagostomum dentatum TaxID=61180 RepID=A0A0B1TN02_OESDE|nr:hypothetical protein OESDEN_02537 [Oesophagostomum dentatum]